MISRGDLVTNDTFLVLVLKKPQVTHQSDRLWTCVMLGGSMGAVDEAHIVGSSVLL